ncbi:hypothetical protein [Nocardia sp. NPDC019395]|uniref:hypothetical protein n=1 Tax=Nocardia sp. NPDC019395 TaxID=3154686 RepID=UPI0034100FFB
MGSRAEIVTLERGKQQRFYTQWGGQSLHLDLLAGPGPALRFATAQRPVENWTADLEAAAVIDFDQRMLLWFSASCEESTLREAVFEVMSITWPGWRLHWAEYRELDLIDYCAGRWPECMVTLTDTTGRARFYMPPIDSGALLAEGPALVATVSGWDVAKRIPAMVMSGIDLDPVKRAGMVWSLDNSADSLVAEATVRWPGWTWESYPDRASTLPEPTPFADPELAVAFRELAASFDQHQLLDAGTAAAASLLRAAGRIRELMGSAGLTLETVEDNTFTHCPVDLSPAELADTREAITVAEQRLRS